MSTTRIDLHDSHGFIVACSWPQSAHAHVFEGVVI
jgi:hypothetical protein